MRAPGNLEFPGVLLLGDVLLVYAFIFEMRQQFSETVGLPSSVNRFGCFGRDGRYV